MLFKYNIAIKTLLTFAMLFGFIIVNGQNTSLDSAKFYLAERLYNEEQVDSALVLFTELSLEIDKGNINPYTQIAMENASSIYYYNWDVENAKLWMHKILDAPVEDSLDTGSLMDPMTNFKHKALMRLWSLEYEENKELALEYLRRSATEYPYYGFPGSCTNLYKHDIMLIKYEFKTLMALERKKEAIEFGISSMLASYYTGNYPGFIKMLWDVCVKEYGKKAFKKEFLAAVEQLKEKEENIYTMNFLDLNIVVYPHQLYLANNSGKCAILGYSTEEFKNHIKKENALYRFILVNGRVKKRRGK